LSRPPSALSSPLFKKTATPFTPCPYLLDFTSKKGYNEEQYLNLFAFPPHKRGGIIGGIYSYGYEIDREQMASKVGEIQAKQLQ
jgi:hypothetical protein